MDNITIVNYQGSKKNLLEFIHTSMTPFINDEDVLLDIFSGTASVAYSYKDTNTVYANDAEKYASIIASALLGSKIDKEIVNEIERIYREYKYPIDAYDEWIIQERKVLASHDEKGIVKFYEKIPTIWVNGEKCFYNLNEYSLFVKYYSTTYFGVEQAKDIDAIRYVIDQVDDKYKNVLLACLFFAMKECVFSKDGHMAQPLDMKKNMSRLIRLRDKKLYSIFISKIEEFASDDFIEGSELNKVFNYNFEQLLNKDEINEVTVIYADPPYTDMQYSRYYHLLNTVVNYDYPEITINNGQVTKGLYLNNRFQSQLSKKSTCLNSMELLIRYSYEHRITLAISFAYPKDTVNQKTDRYVMDIDDLIAKCKEYYPEKHVHVKTQDYKHSNNRNSESKNVYEYLVICERVEK